MKLKKFIESQAFHVLKLFWVTGDLLLIGYCVNLGIPITILSLIKLVWLGMAINVLIIPIWLVSSILNDVADPYLSVWDSVETWES
jgi:hypothetical protein